jgi:hypothetical protein
MSTPITPNTGYAFRHKETGALALVLYLGTGDSLGNYEEITEEEYKRTLTEREEMARKKF